MSRFVWGVDVAVSRLAFAFADLDSESVRVQMLPMGTNTREGERLGHVLSMVRRYAFQARTVWPPEVVWIEQPSGKYRNPQLVYVTGVVQAGLFEALGCPVWTVPSSAWKKRTVGVGNATKVQVAAWVESERVVFDGQDEADACAIAMAGRLMVQSGAWEVAA